MAYRKLLFAPARRGQLLFADDPLVTLQRALDSIEELAVRRRQQPHDRVLATRSADPAPSNKIDALANAVFVGLHGAAYRW